MDASGEDRIATLSTDELRREVARLQSLLVDEEEEDEAEAHLDDEELQNSNEEGGPFSWVEGITLKYTNGDVYKVRARASRQPCGFSSRTSPLFCGTVQQTAHAARRGGRTWTLFTRENLFSPLC